MDIPKGNFEGLIFFHDGTLSLSMLVHFEGWISSFRKNGGNFNFTREIAQSYAGVGMHDTVEILNERYGCSMNPQQVVKDQESYFFATSNASTGLVITLCAQMTFSSCFASASYIMSL